MNREEIRILLVDDEPSLLKMVSSLLKKEGYRKVDTTENCRQALELFSKNKYQIVLLDIMLPDGDGFSLFSKFRRISNDEVPVIFLSAKDEDQARLKGLGLGADDYITKPFLPQELLLRLKAVLRRTYHVKEKETEEVTQIGEVTVDWDAGVIHATGQEYLLTAKEFILLKKLCENRGKILSINTLCDTLWPDGSYGYENSLMVHIRRLREKIEKNPSRPEYLVTVRGLGYKMN